ncbi:MAG: hypothetical protein JOZ54_14790, partial [Acidobacteria bacterium]|nr:hypothetical protein [Acidobacteriota bacterium]
MKEDILEQVVDDYLQAKGYFTRHNLKFRPRADHALFVKNQDSNHSDIDVIGIHPRRSGVDAVVVVSCKSWQGGFDVEGWLSALEHNKTVSGREAWKHLRELVRPKWSEAFVDAVEEVAGTRLFTYVTAVTAVRGDARRWEEYAPFRDALQGNPVRLLSLRMMLDDLYPMLSTTVANSDLGRLLQLLKACGWS